VRQIRHIPTTIVQGRYDVVCPCTTAFELHKQMPEAHFILVPDAGHSAKEPGITHHLVEATDRYRSIAAK
jgi:proline iminopeptidase